MRHRVLFLGVLFVEKLISVAIAAPAAKSSSTAPTAPAATSAAAWTSGVEAADDVAQLVLAEGKNLS